MRTMRWMASTFLMGLLLLAISPRAEATFIVNGSFEDDPFTANGNYELGLVGNDVTGWFIPAGDGVYPWGLQDGAFGASTPYGNQWLVLGRWDTGASFTIQQTMTGLVSGDSYDLSFAIASEQDCCSMIEVSFLSGSSTAAQIFAAPNSGQYWTEWATVMTSFVATSSSVTLQFRNVNPTTAGYDIGLDNVVVTGRTAAPEPGTVFLMALGLIGLGTGVRRRSRR